MNSNIENTVQLETIDNLFEQLMKDLELKKFLEYKLEKNNFNLDDLKAITEIKLDGKTITKRDNEVHFETIELFPNLKKIEIKNLDVFEKDIKKITNLEDISFRNCKIYRLNNLTNVKKLSINNSIVDNINNIEKMSELEELELINIEINDFNFLKNLKKIKILKLKNIKGATIESIDFTLPIEYLSIVGINNLDLEWLKKYENLKTISIEREKAEEFKEILEKLKYKNIEILLDDIYKY